MNWWKLLGISVLMAYLIVNESERIETQEKLESLIKSSESKISDMAWRLGQLEKWSQATRIEEDKEKEELLSLLNEINRRVEKHLKNPHVYAIP